MIWFVVGLVLGFLLGSAGVHMNQQSANIKKLERVDEAKRLKIKGWRDLN